MRRLTNERRGRRTILGAMAAAILVAACQAPAAADTIVTFTTNLGAFDVQLYDSQVPTTVANFLNYVNAGQYSDTIFHRSTTYNPAGIQIVQGGGFGYSSGWFAVSQDTPIPLEAGLPNLRGTIAMARTNDPNSATSQWFFNVTDNLGLDPGPGVDGYAVFGQVLGNGMQVIDAIAALDVWNANQAILGQNLGPFGELPLINGNTLVMVTSVAVPEPSTIVLTVAGLFGLAAFRRRPFRRPDIQA